MPTDLGCMGCSFWSGKGILYLYVKGTFKDCYALYAVLSRTWCGLFEMLPRYKANYSFNEADIPYLFLSSHRKVWYFIWDCIDNFFICRDNLVHILQLARASVAIMAMVDVGHCKRACCMRWFESLYDGSFEGQKGANLNPWHTSNAALGSSRVCRLQSTVWVHLSEPPVWNCARRRFAPPPVPWASAIACGRWQPVNQLLRSTSARDFNQDFTCGAHANHVAWPLGLSAAPI